MKKIIKKMKNYFLIFKNIFKKKINILTLITYLFLFFITFIFIFPFFLMFILSAKDFQDIVQNNYLSWPNKWKLWENYKESVQLNSSSFLKLFWNTFRITFFSTLLGTICSILTSYVLSILKINSRLKSIMIIFLLLSLMTVSETLVLTNYRTVSDWGWVNHGKDSEIPFGNDYALIFPFLINTIHILLLIKTFNQIPKELYLSAKIDGTSDWKYLWKIIVPIAKPTIIVTVIFRIVAAWNAYSWPALIGAKLLTNVTRANFNTDSGMEKINIQMATAILINVPLFFIFICFKKYIISGANRSGIKG